MNIKNKIKFAHQEKQKQERIRRKLMQKGVILVAPETIFLSTDINGEYNLILDPGTYSIKFQYYR